MTLLHTFGPLVHGRLVRRYKRFFADVALEDGSTFTAHCPNTGPMTGISTPGSPVWLSRSSNPARKLAFTLEIVEVEDGARVGVNTALPNRVVLEGLRRGTFAELEPYRSVRCEARYGAENSRIDFLLDGGDHAPLYLEVKNTTWSHSLGDTRQALFPDCVTERGQKHLRELMRVRALGERSAVMFFINRSDCQTFHPGDEADPLYGRLLREAFRCGVLVLPCRFDVGPEGVRYLGTVPLQFG
jgi:sugar fermentation stimulation protein A